MGLIFISVVQNRIKEFGTIVAFFIIESKLLPLTQIISLPNNCSNSISAINVKSLSAVAIKVEFWAEVKELNISIEERIKAAKGLYFLSYVAGLKM